MIPILVFTVSVLVFTKLGEHALQDITVLPDLNHLIKKSALLDSNALQILAHRQLVKTVITNPMPYRRPA
jgi:hypothetical protein